MDFIRQTLSLNTNRFKSGKYNLDLSFISPRIIGMAFPAKGFEQLYKNPIENV